MCIQNVKTLAEKSVTKIIFKKKKNGQINGMIDSLLQQYNMSYPMFVPNFKILNAVVHEKSFTEKSLHTNTQTNIVTEKTKTIYPFLFLMPWV